MELKPLRKWEAGFSAIETLIALFLLTIGISAVATGLTEGLRIAGEADQRQRAIALAYDKMIEKLALGHDAAAVPVEPSERAADGVLVGEDAPEGVARRWWVETGWSDPELARVFVEARWVRRGESQTYAVSGLLASGRTP